MLNRKHPYLCLFVAGVIAGLKFPFNWNAGEDVSRKSKMLLTCFGILPLPVDHAEYNTPENMRIVDAWQRIETWGGWGKLAHDLTNLIIEWVRRWCPYAVKFLCSIIVYGALAAIGLLIAF